MRIKITEVADFSYWYSKRNIIIDNTYTVEGTIYSVPDGWFSISVEELDKYAITCKYIEVPEPSAMSELGKQVNKMTFDPTQAIKFAAIAANKAIDYTVEAIKEADEWNKRFTAFNKAAYPKKLTWWEKVCGYDELFARMESAEGVRDHYKAIAEVRRQSLNQLNDMLSEALRDRDLHARTADNWQAKLVKANEEVLQLSDICKYLLNYLDLLDEQKKAEK